MEWQFGEFVLNADRAELMGPDGSVHVERYPLNVLIHLIENADRVVTRDDLIQAVWGGRIVSDATVSTAVKHARRAVGDTGSAQEVIKTVHGRGFRFVAELKSAKAPARVAPKPERKSETTKATELIGAGRPSLAVMRFQSLGDDPNGRMLATAIPAELISSISRVRWLHVIARGSTFQFDPLALDPGDVGRRLSVRYVMTGLIEVVGDRLTVSVEILSTDDGALVWSDRFSSSLSEIHDSRQSMVAAVVSALELAIPSHEAAGSRRLSENEFDAWSHFHLGLSHIFKFNQDDNQIAAQHFQRALELDSEFARAHAGLSFTHWQNAFMQFGDDRQALLSRAVDSANRALDIDARDPFANFNMGRARWLEGDIEGSHSWLDRALQINPNFAQCHYSKGLVSALDGRADTARESSQLAMSLSPLDPLSYGMFGVQAMAAMSREDYLEAKQMSEKAMQSPGAHFYIAIIAAIANELQGDKQAAHRWRAHALKNRPDVNADMFFAAFPFRNSDLRQRVNRALTELDLV